VASSRFAALMMARLSSRDEESFCGIAFGGFARFRTGRVLAFGIASFPPRPTVTMKTSGEQRRAGQVLNLYIQRIGFGVALTFAKRFTLSQTKL
jgi:hypothetical protein